MNLAALQNSLSYIFSLKKTENPLDLPASRETLFIIRNSILKNTESKPQISNQTIFHLLDIKNILFLHELLGYF